MDTILKSPLRPYPLATKSQEVVPHDVAAPAGCYKIAISAGASYVLQDLPLAPILSICSDAPVLAVFTNEAVEPTIVEGELIGGGFFCPPGVTVIGRPETSHVWFFNESTEEAVVYAQLMHTWNILGTVDQTTRI